jgi:hypothetical protein
LGDPLRETHIEPVTVLRMSLDVLATRVFRWLTAAGAFSLFAWVCARPEWIRFAAACVFTLAVHVPTWWGERKRRS